MSHENTAFDTLLTKRREPPTGRPFREAWRLEPLNCPAPGTILTPHPDIPLRLHMDSVRHRANQQTGLIPPAPLVRIVRDVDEVYHARSVRLLGPCEFREDYATPLPRRPGAVCLVYTTSPIEILE